VASTQGDYGDDQLTLAGHDIAVRCQYLPGGIETIIKNFRSQGQPGSAETSVVIEAVVDLRLDGKPVNLRAKKPFPRVRDDETGQTLLEFLLAYIVTTEEGWLAKKWPDIFAEYQRDDREQVKDPTTPRKGATTGS
jgi:hypothetical protein